MKDFSVHFDTRNDEKKVSMNSKKSFNVTLVKNKVGQRDYHD